MVLAVVGSEDDVEWRGVVVTPPPASKLRATHTKLRTLNQAQQARNLDGQNVQWKDMDQVFQRL